MADWPASTARRATTRWPARHLDHHLHRAPSSATFSGMLEGLGNTITGLTINGGIATTDVGLIGTLRR